MAVTYQCEFCSAWVEDFHNHMCDGKAKAMRGVGIKVVLGQKYRDKTHKIEGVAVIHSEYLSGCSRTYLEYVKDGEVKGLSVDDPMLEVVEDAPVVKVPEKLKGEKLDGPGDMVSRPGHVARR